MAASVTDDGDALRRMIAHLDREWAQADRLLVIAANTRRELSFVPLFEQRHAGNHALRALTALVNDRRPQAMSAVISAIDHCKRSRFDSTEGIIAFLHDSLQRAIASYSASRLARLNPGFDEFASNTIRLSVLISIKRQERSGSEEMFSPQDELDDIDAIEKLVKYSSQLKLPPRTLASRKFTRWLMSLSAIASTAAVILVIYSLTYAGSFEDLSIYAKIIMVMFGTISAVLSFTFRVVDKDD